VLLRGPRLRYAVTTNVAKDGKFGTFGGVFTPSVLTMLGVIMYLRLPWVVGSGGLYVALGIIVVAHVISVSTGLSISSIATDKKVGAGGPYYIVSRSLGLPIGGTLGLALFTGLAFSVSLYIIGFSESFLSNVGIARTANAIRICGSITLVLITVVTLISTEFAIKTQYLILTLIGLSLVSVFLGTPHPPTAGAHLTAPANGPSMAVLFGIFFPAVTGFTAGVNMSGDLRNPNSSIPRGTMAAIAVGLVVYVGLAVYVGLRVPAKMLLEDQDVLIHVAWVPALVVAGIWGATLSSAIGSIMGAPRILQALSTDGITPRWFGKGYGRTNEPRNALVLAFAIAEGGILIAELDSIARIVSMVFLTTYGFLNLSAAIESWASPDFRPAFRIPKSVSVVGAVTAVLVMIQLDLLAMAGATVLMAGLFFYLQRRQLELEAGDAWAGMWSTLIRSGLARLSRSTEKQRNWRPVILMFRSPDSPARRALRSMAKALVAENGIVTDFEITDAKDSATTTADATEDDTQVGVFDKRITCEDRYDTVANICRYHGFASLEPNTLLLPWSTHVHDNERFARLIDGVSELGLNILLFDPGPEEGPRKRIDVWWSPDAGNLRLSIALLRYITREPSFERASVRFLLASTDTSANDYLRGVTRHLLREARFSASIRVINDTLREKRLEEHVLAESIDADLTLLGLPNEMGQLGPEYQASTDHLVETLKGVLLLRAGAAFEESIELAREAAISFLPPGEGEAPAALPDLPIPETPDLARVVSDMAEGYQELVTRFHEDCVRRLHARHLELTRTLIAAVERYFAGIEKAAAGANPRRTRNAANRARSTLLLESKAALDEFREKHLSEQSSILSERIEAFLTTDRVVDRRRRPDELVVHRRREDFAPRANDTDYVRGFKLRRRIASRLSRADGVSYRIPIAQLQDYYFHEASRRALMAAVRRLETDTHQLMVHLGKLLSSTRALESEADDAEALAAALDEQRGQILDRLNELVRRSKEAVGAQQWALLVAAREVASELSVDIDRLDILQLIKKERRLPKDASALRDELREVPQRWEENQARLIELGQLALQLSAFQHRLWAVTIRERDAVLLAVKNGVLSQCEQLQKALEEQAAELDKDDDTAGKELGVHLELAGRFEPKPVIDGLLREAADLTGELPETLMTLTDDSVRALEEGRSEGVEMTELPVRRLVQFLLESQFVAGLQDELDEIPKAEHRAAGVLQDVVRLVTFQLAEAEAAEGAERADLREQLRPVLENGIERVSAESKRLAELVPRIDAAFAERLRGILDGTNAYDLSSTASNLEQHIRMRQGRIAVSGARGLARRALRVARTAMVNVVYRQSEGLLLARQLEADAGHEGTLVDRVSALVARCTPRPEIVESLPFYYRQLFLGQSTMSDAFWVGRAAELARAKRAVAAFRRGTHGALFVTGARGSGKTALCQRIVSDNFAGREVARVQPRPGGSSEPRVFEAALAKALHGRGPVDELLALFPDGSAIVIDDLELWWERSATGLRVVERILELFEQHGRRLLFIVCLSRQTLALLDRLRNFSDRAASVIECAPMPAEGLKNIVTLRHASTGAKFSLGERGEDELGELPLARLFARHFDHSRGVVGAALRGWITHVDKATSDSLVIRTPQPEKWEVLDELRPSWKALLLQLVLHKRMSRVRLERVSGISREELARELDALRRTGLVVETRQRVVEINPFLQHAVSDRFLKQGLLS